MKKFIITTLVVITIAGTEYAYAQAVTDPAVHLAAWSVAVAWSFILGAGVGSRIGKFLAYAGLGRVGLR